MNISKKSLAGAATPNQAGNAKDTDNDQRKSHSYSTADQERAQAGYISQFLSAGAGQGLHLRDLVRITHLSEREVRKQIHIERRRNIPILSNNRDGYYLPSDEEEKSRCVASLRRRAAEILEAADAIEEAGGGSGDGEPMEQYPAGTERASAVGLLYDAHEPRKRET